MAVAIRMPRWGMIMEEGSLLAWRKKEGEPVSQGEAIAEIESDKAVNEIEAPGAGVVARILVREGTTAVVGALLAIIREPGEGEEAVQALLDAERRDGAAVQAAGSEAPEGQPSERTTADSVAASAARRRSSPAARHLAAQSGMDWRDLAGSGPGGRVQINDVQGALRGTLPRGLSPLRQAIARRTALSITAPQAALCREIDLTDLIALRSERKAGTGGGAPSLTAFLVERVAAALCAVPVLNSRLLPQGHVISKAVHMGVVVSTEGGIMVPVIRDVQERSLEEIDRALADFVRRAREKSLRREELEGGTFTLSNAGPLGIDFFQPLLNPPEVAILGIGQIRRRPTVVGTSIMVRETAYFCLSTDHRVIDAEPAGEFLRRLDELTAGSVPTRGK